MHKVKYLQHFTRLPYVCIKDVKVRQSSSTRLGKTARSQEPAAHLAAWEQRQPTLRHVGFHFTIFTATFRISTYFNIF
jgi:hypothetical protein